MSKYVKTVGKGVMWLVILGLVYYFGVAKLLEEELSSEQILSAYQYSNSYQDFAVHTEQGKSREFTFTSFDGEKVYGQITLPSVKREKYPVLVGVHAMGRSYPRWYQSELKGRPTVSSVNQITELALAKGYAVVAIDARFHGKRKLESKPLRSIWNDLHYFGDKSDYQDMIVNTVIDNRVLLDWIEKQPELDAEHITVAGYSMGGQVSLLLGAVDKRVDQIAAIVPPYLEDTVATVATKNLVSQIKQDARVLIIYGEHDDVATVEQNRALHEKLTSTDKQLIGFDADHILPEVYVEDVGAWLK